jgi:predicted AAA+ superfamily ATPase
MYKRDMSDLLLEFAQGYPVIGVTGPRQSGKTTLVRSLFNHLPYLSLENMDTRFQALNDPRAFLKKYTEGAIFDEVHYAPEIVSYLQEIVDSSRVMGRYVITQGHKIL